MAGTPAGLAAVRAGTGALRRGKVRIEKWQSGDETRAHDRCGAGAERPDERDDERDDRAIVTWFKEKKEFVYSRTSRRINSIAFQRSGARSAICTDCQSLW